MGNKLSYAWELFRLRLKLCLAYAYFSEKFILRFPKSVVAIHEDREISHDTKIFQEGCERWLRYACILFHLLRKFKSTNFSTYTPQKQAQ